jgi:uncharacterized glyoxalase superfamily protein PhnB
MSKYPQFSLAVNLCDNNIERIEAFELYKKVFNAKKISESYPPDGSDIHIVMEINGFVILLAPGEKEAHNSMITCQLKFENENNLRRAYDLLIQEGRDYSIGSYPWAAIGALVTDKYGITWWLYI